MDAVTRWGRWRSRGLRYQSKDLLTNAQRQPADEGGWGRLENPSSVGANEQRREEVWPELLLRPEMRTAMKASGKRKWC